MLQVPGVSPRATHPAMVEEGEGAGAGEGDGVGDGAGAGAIGYPIT